MQAIPVEEVSASIIDGLGDPPKKVWMLQTRIYGTPKYYGVHTAKFWLLAAFVSETLALEYLARHSNTDGYGMQPVEFPWAEARDIAAARPVDGILVAMSDKVASPFFTR